MINNDIKEILKEIQKMRKIGEHERALEVIENLYKTEKDMDKSVTAFLQYQKGLIYSKRKEKEKAMDAFSIAIDNSKSATQKIVIQAANYEVLGHNIDAYFTLKNLSLQKSSSGERNMADSLIKEMLTTNRILKKSVEFVEKLDESEIDEKAAEEIGSLLSVSKNDPYLWTLFGKFYTGKGQYEKALNCFEKGSGGQLKKFESLVGAIHCHILLGNIEIAKINLKAAKDSAKTEQQIADLEKIRQTITTLKPPAKEETSEEELLIEHNIVTPPPPPPEEKPEQSATSGDEDDFREGDLLNSGQITVESAESEKKSIEVEEVKETIEVPPPPPENLTEETLKDMLKTEEEEAKAGSFEKFQKIDEIEKSTLWARVRPEKAEPEKNDPGQKRFNAKISLLNSVVSIAVFLSFVAGAAAGIIFAMKYF
ncbi:hypothetical protein JW890_06855 [candidate division WOR-3 bacterium]|nr:hypothetical protein [candidate division WOR-3 bacterium]